MKRQKFSNESKMFRLIFSVFSFKGVVLLPFDS
jgi:hypothetical protein